MTDFNHYQYTVKEKIKYLFFGVLIITILGFMFYKSLIGAIFLSPLIYFYMRMKKEFLRRELMWKLNLEFRDGILAMSAALEAGYSAENAMDEAYKDLKSIYSDNSLILKEFAYIINQIRMNITVETALLDFSERSGIEDILSFAEVFATAKRTGGDLMKVIKITANIISDKIEIKREIVTMITAKRFEANIMKLIPLLIIAYLLLSSPGFLDPLYHNVIGVMLMTVCLVIYLGAYLLVDKIIAIEV